MFDTLLDVVFFGFCLGATAWGVLRLVGVLPGA